MITKHQLDRALGNIRLLGPDIPSFRRDAKLVSDYIEQLERQQHGNQPDTVVRSSGAKQEDDHGL